MTAGAILEKLTARGIRLQRDGDSLLAAPREALTDDLRALIREYKSDLLEAVESPQVERPQVLAIHAEVAPGATAAHGRVKGATAATPPNAATVQVNALPDPAAEARRQQVLAMLWERPGVRYAVLTDTEADPEVVLLTLAIRDKATCELRIPRQKYDGVRLLELIERHCGTMR